MKVLSFAAVGCHGREWWTRTASRALGVLLVAASAAAQPASTTQDAASELAGRIAGAVASGETIQIASNAADARLGADVARLLRARGLPVVDANGSATVTLSCGVNLRDRVCAAEIRRNGALQLAVASSVKDPIDADANAGIALQLTPMLAQRGAVLDVAAVGDQWLVLEPNRLSLRPRDDAAAGSRPPASAPIVTSRAWPRDLRGRLRVSGNSFEAQLPGVTCRGTIAPLTSACADETEPWPLPIANTGMVAGRNYFTTPEGLPFYGAAPLGAAPDSGWMAVDQQGRLTVLDQTRAARTRGAVADDVARVAASCSPAAYIIAASRASAADDVDELQLLRVAGAATVVAQTLRLPGRVTALWGDASSESATVILRYPDGTRHEALRLRVSCAR